jgi:hypothetical protein
MSMTAKPNEDAAVLECYRRLYKAATQIIEDVIKEYKIKPKLRQQAFRVTIHLGASPKTKLKVE